MDLSVMKTYPLKDRKNRVSIKNFSDPDSDSLYNLVPNILTGSDFKKFVSAVRNARENGGTLLWMMGAHVIKCGLSPVIIKLMEKGFISHLATNGAAPIHDMELSLIGETSEDVADSIKNGTFGMAKETGEIMNQMIKSPISDYLGYSIGKSILDGEFPNKKISVFANAVKNEIPVTVHSAIGTEIIQMHPSYDFANQSRKTYADFMKIIESVKKLNKKSVVINVGSGVMMPEVFLRSLNISRNLGAEASGFTSAVFDMERAFRPYENIVHRPTQGSGKGYYFVGQHELMIPLLYWFLMNEGEDTHE